MYINKDDVNTPQFDYRLNAIKIPTETNNEQSEKGIPKTIPFIIASKRIKCSGINQSERT